MTFKLHCFFLTVLQVFGFPRTLNVTFEFLHVQRRLQVDGHASLARRPVNLSFFLHRLVGAALTQLQSFLDESLYLNPSISSHGDFIDG